MSERANETKTKFNKCVTTMLTWKTVQQIAHAAVAVANLLLNFIFFGGSCAFNCSFLVRSIFLSQFFAFFLEFIPLNIKNRTYGSTAKMKKRYTRAAPSSGAYISL